MGGCLFVCYVLVLVVCIDHCLLNNVKSLLLGSILVNIDIWPHQNCKLLTAIHMIDYLQLSTTINSSQSKL